MIPRSPTVAPRSKPRPARAIRYRWGQSNLPIFATLTATNYAEFIFPPDLFDMGPLLTLADPDYATARMSATLPTAAAQTRNWCRSTGLVAINERPVSDRMQRCSNDRYWVVAGGADFDPASVISLSRPGRWRMTAAGRYRRSLSRDGMAEKSHDPAFAPPGKTDPCRSLSGKFRIPTTGRSAYLIA